MSSLLLMIVNKAVAVRGTAGHSDRSETMVRDQEKLSELRRSFLQRARVLRGEISGKLGEAADEAGGMNRGGDYGDQAFASGESSLDFAEAGRDIDELRAIDAALSSIDQGKYGLCIDCGDEIPSQRLLAQPLALRCLKCQQRHEHVSTSQSSSI